jgi:hypothetical protein
VLGVQRSACCSARWRCHRFVWKSFGGWPKSPVKLPTFVEQDGPKCVHMSSRLVTLLSQINPVLSLTSFHLCLGLPSRFSSSSFSSSSSPLHFLISSSYFSSVSSSPSFYPPVPSTQLYNVFTSYKLGCHFSSTVTRRLQNHIRFRPRENQVVLKSLEGYIRFRPPLLFMSASPSTMRIPLAAWSKVWVCGRSLAGIAGSNPAGVWMVVFFECCVLCR